LISVPLTQLKKRSILVAGGNRKIKAIDGALRGGYANVLHHQLLLFFYYHLQLK
ncbi:sugar-binding domain-containing protein, partial [Bacillus sp. B-TM1]